MNRRRWRTAAVGLLLLVWVGWVVWLLLVPPVVSPPGVPERYHLSCQPLGRDISDVSMLGAMSDEEEGFVDWYAQNRAGTSDADRARNLSRAEITTACSEARTNRLASMMFVVTGGLALLVTGTAVAVVNRPRGADGDGTAARFWSRSRPEMTSFFRKIVSATKLDSVCVAIRSRRWRAATVLLVLIVWVAAISWSSSASPTIEMAGMPGRLVCQPIGGGAAGSSPPAESYERWEHERWEFIDAYIEERIDVDDSNEDDLYSQANREVEVARVCAEARTNRLAILVVLVGAGLALIVVAAPWVALGRPTEKPTPPPPAAGAVRKRPPPRPPGLRARARHRPEGDSQL